MISTRVMDFKLQEAAEGLGEDSSGKKKFKFKTFKKFFGKKKRKESPSSTGSNTWKQSQAKDEVIAMESRAVGYDSEDELQESRGALGGRALSHDSIFIPESGQDPTRPVRVFSQENVCDRIKALQVKIQCNVKMGPPPSGGLTAKRGDDAGMSSEDDGLPRSPPEMCLLHDIGPSAAIKVSLTSSSRPPSPDQLSSSHPSNTPSINVDSTMAPMANFDYPPEFSSCLDNSAAKHKLLVKPRNQRSSKMRRLSSRAQSESLSDLTCTLEEEQHYEKPLPAHSSEDEPNVGQQDGVLDQGPEPGGPATMLPRGDVHARRARLQHCPALRATMEEEGGGESSPGDNPSSRPATPEVTEPKSVPASCLESPFVPEGSPDPNSENQREEPSLTGTYPPSRDTAKEVVCTVRDDESRLSPHIPEEDTTPPGTSPATPAEAPSGPGRPDHNVPPFERAGTEYSEAPAPSPSVPKSCLRHKAQVASKSFSVSLAPPASESPPEEPTLCALDKEATPQRPPKAKLAKSLQGGPERVAQEPKLRREGGEPQSTKNFSVSSGREWPHTGHGEHLGHSSPVGPAAVRLPLLRSSLSWRSEATLDDLQAPPEPQIQKLVPQEPPSPTECGSQDTGDMVASQTRLGQSPHDVATIPATRDPCPAAQELPTCGDRSPFPIKLRSTSLSLRHRDVSSPEVKGTKRYSAEVRLEKGGLALFSKEDKSHMGMAPATRGTRSPNGQGKGRARPSEQLGSKPPLPRKPLLQTFTLPSPPASPDVGDVSPGELDKPALPPDPRKERRSPLRGTGILSRAPRWAAITRVPLPGLQIIKSEKCLPPSATGPGAEGQPGPPWITITRQKLRGCLEEPPDQEDKPGAQTLKSETGKQARVPERAQEPMKQADFVRSKSFLIAPAKPTVIGRQGTKPRLQEGLQRGISLSHQNLAAQSAAMTEKELHQLKRASYASSDQPSWMELARKKSQAWSDMPQIIK